ncbi:hypothetical protein Lal_00042048 [Lupinus albus]|nr:hypothetical protein Lal_00042048 [Lupinus albus]
MAINSRMFMYASDFSRVEKNCSEIALYLLKAIEDIGSSNVLQVVIDNATNCKPTDKQIENVHKHNFWSLGIVHTLNLILLFHLSG